VSTKAAPSLLEAHDVHSHYGESHVLRGVSLAIGRGESLGLLGRNGMGKTTLIRTLLAHVRASRGRVLVNGRECTHERPHRIARMGIAYVPEGRGIFSSLSVMENLAIAERGAANGQHRWTVERVLELFPRLAQRRANRGDQLSGGEQQMLAIGRALLANPRLIMLDEATEGLAPIIRDEIWRIIRLIRESGVATLIVDKSVAAVTEMADRIVILVKGEVVFEGSPADLKAKPELMHRHLGV